MEKYVVWGAGEHTRLLLDNFLGLKDHVEVFLDKDSRKKELNAYRSWSLQRGHSMRSLSL